jgi:kynurenine formamidase
VGAAGIPEEPGSRMAAAGSPEVAAGTPGVGAGSPEAAAGSPEAAAGSPGVGEAGMAVVAGSPDAPFESVHLHATGILRSWLGWPELSEPAPLFSLAVPTLPAEDEVLSWFESLSNWGRWGSDDQLGTLNLVTLEKRRQAVALVREGITVSCAWDIDGSPRPDPVAVAPQRFMIGTGQGLSDPARVVPPGTSVEDRAAAAMEYIGLVFHGFTVTHVDGLSHMFWDGKMYNDQPAEKVSASLGATHHGITTLKDGVVTRGVLLDAARLRGRDWLEPGEAIFPEDLEAAEARQDVRVTEGDALLLRTGYGRKRREHGSDDVRRVGRAGWHSACLPWFRERGVGLIGSDTAQDALPSGYASLRNPVHIIGIVAMGLWLIDNCDLEELRATCERLGRWEFLLVLAPLRLVGGTGSPANPLAIF